MDPSDNSEKWYITVDGGRTGFYWSFKRTRMCYVTRDDKVYAVSLPEIVLPNIAWNKSGCAKCEQKPPAKTWHGRCIMCEGSGRMS